MAYIRDSAVGQDGAGGGVSSHTGVLPAYETGDMLVFCVAKDTVNGGDLTTPSGWSQFDADYQVASLIRIAIFYKTNVTAGSETAPTTTSTDTDTWISLCFSVDEYDTADPFGAFITYDTGSSTNSFTIDALTTDEDQALVVWYIASDNVAGISIDGPALVDASDGPEISHACYYDTQVATGSTGTKAGKTTDARRLGGFVFAINASSSSDVENAKVSGGALDGFLEYFQESSTASGIGAPSIATVGGLTTANGVVPQQTADAGTMPYQRAHQFSATISDTTIYGIEYDFASALDLSSGTDTYLNFHLGMREPKEETFLGSESELGIVVAATSETGTAWRAWQVYARGAENRITNIFDSGFCLDPNDTETLLDSSGTFDETKITSIHFLCHAVVSGTTRLFVSRLTTVEPWVLTNGSVRDPARVASIMPYQEGIFQVVIKRLGASQFLVPALIQIGDGGTTDTYAKESNVSIEFPPQAVTKRLTYHMADNAFGVIFKLTADDYLLWENGSTFSSHPYRLDAPDSLITADVANFNSWTFSGPGKTVFQYGFTFNDCTFNGRDKITGNGAYFDGCLFTNSAGTSALTITLNSHLTARLHNCEFTNNTYGIEIDVSNLNQIVELNNVTFSGNTADIYIPASRTADLTIRINGGDTPTVQNDGSGAVTIENNVTLNVTFFVGGVQTDVTGAQLAIYKVSDSSEILNVTVSGSSYSESYAYTSNEAVTLVARKGTASAKYKRYTAPDTIRSTGLNHSAALILDTLAT